MTPADLLIIGAGPCGLACAISAMRAGLRVEVLESSVVVASIAQYPTYTTFFSTAEKLSLGGLPFIIPTAKPSRRDALAYYRAVVTYFGLEVHQYETVESLAREGDAFVVRTARRGRPHQTRARAVI